MSEHLIYFCKLSCYTQMFDINAHGNSTPARLFIKRMCRWVDRGGVCLIHGAGALTRGCIVENAAPLFLNNY